MDKAESEEVKEIKRLESEREKLLFLLLNIHSIQLSRFTFLLGITLGIVGNFVVSYFVEFERTFLNLDKYGILFRLMGFSILLWYFERRYKDTYKKLDTLAISFDTHLEEIDKKLKNFSRVQEN